MSTESGGNSLYGTPTRPPRPAHLHIGELDNDYEDGDSNVFYPISEEGYSETNHLVVGGIPPPSFRASVSSPAFATGNFLSYDPGSFPFPEPGATTQMPPDPSSTRRRATTGSRAKSQYSSDKGGNVDRSSRTPLSGPPLLRQQSSSYTLAPDAASLCSSNTVHSPNGSMQMMFEKVIPERKKSTAIPEQGLSKYDKPWIGKRDVREYVSWVLTWSMVLFCGGAAAVMCLLDARSIQMMGDLCLVLDDDFSNGLNRDIWFHEVDMGGFGNREFEMTTNSDNNTFVEDGVLYIVPTLTEDVIGREAVFNGYTYNVSGCTSTNMTSCSATSNSTIQKLINPVQSGRISTRFSHSITYGRVEVRARLPRGDWLWPAIWMLPVGYDYGPWPMSGEIDIMESRGNSPDYKFQGRSYVRTSLNWGPTDFINSVFRTYGWWTKPRMDFSDDFHTFVLEWSPTFLRTYVDSRLQMPFSINFDRPFFERGDYPATAFNGSAEVVIDNPWKGSGSNSAPFDKPFYLIMNVAVGGTNGWFPDTIGEKSWYDGSTDAMHQFVMAQSKWYKTWPEDLTRRGMAIDYVKMWQSC